MTQRGRSMHACDWFICHFFENGCLLRTSPSPIQLQLVKSPDTLLEVFYSNYIPSQYSMRAAYGVKVANRITSYLW